MVGGDLSLDELPAVLLGVPDLGHDVVHPPVRHEVAGEAHTGPGGDPVRAGERDEQRGVVAAAPHELLRRLARGAQRLGRPVVDQLQDVVDIAGVDLLRTLLGHPVRGEVPATPVVKDEI